MSNDFDDFYRSTSRRALRYALALTGDTGTAQDITQEAYVRAWQRWRTISDYGHADAWVRLVIARLAMDGWRRIGLRRRFDGLALSPRASGPPGDDTVLITTALRRLPMRQRQAIALHYLMDLPLDEVAAEMSVPVGTVKSWLSRGRTTLSGLIGDTGADGGPQLRSQPART